MKVRLITSALGAALFFVLLLSPPIVFQVAAVIVSFIATYEIYSVTGISKKPTIIGTYVFQIALCALFGWAHLKIVDYSICFFVMALYLAYLFAIMVFDYKRVRLNDASTAFFASVAMALCFSYIIPLRAAEHSALLIVALFAATWSGDGGAYFVGIRFGKHKLSPVLSPKKTVEGAIGGVLGSIVAMGIYSLIVIYALNLKCNIGCLMALGVGCSILGPIGDIATSAIKREFSVKDYGNIFPGHGGILDRFDSTLLTIPFVYFMSQIVTLISK